MDASCVGPEVVGGPGSVDGSVDGETLVGVGTVGVVVGIEPVGMGDGPELGLSIEQTHSSYPEPSGKQTCVPLQDKPSDVVPSHC